MTIESGSTILELFLAIRKVEDRLTCETDAAGDAGSVLQPMGLILVILLQKNKKKNNAPRA